MNKHLSHPDQLMARALGVCWHPPTSDRWPCTAGPKRKPNGKDEMTRGEILQAVAKAAADYREATGELTEDLSLALALAELETPDAGS